jgi:hypothetical protein
VLFILAVLSLATVVGAVPGALPPVIGWAAARGSLGLEAWVLFAIVFVWQMPHVLAVSWLYREDYARGGIRVLPVEDPNGRSTAFQMVNYAAALVPVSLMPTAVGIAGRPYLAGAIVLGVALLALTVRFARNRTPGGARRLFAASLVYPPVLWLLMLGDRSAVHPGAVTIQDLPALNAAERDLRLPARHGYYFTKGSISQHRACMIAALVVSSLFLISYVVYHAHVGSKPFPGHGWSGVYFTILITHVILAAVIVPMALVTVRRGLRH